MALVLVIQRARGECRSLWLSPAMCPLKTSRSLKHTGRSEHESKGSAIGSAVRSGAPGRTPSGEGLRRWRAVIPVLPPIEVFRFPAEVASRSPVGLPRQVGNSASSPSVGAAAEPEAAPTKLEAAGWYRKRGSRVAWLRTTIQRAQGECRSPWLSPAMCPPKTSRSPKHTVQSEHESRGSAMRTRPKPQRGPSALALGAEESKSQAFRPGESAGAYGSPRQGVLSTL